MSRLHDHTQRHTIPDITPLDEISARHSDLDLTTHTVLITNSHPCPWKDSNPQSQQASSRRPTSQTARQLLLSIPVYTTYQIYPRFYCLILTCLYRCASGIVYMKIDTGLYIWWGFIAQTLHLVPICWKLVSIKKITVLNNLGTIRQYVGAACCGHCNAAETTIGQVLSKRLINLWHFQRVVNHSTPVGTFVFTDPNSAHKTFLPTRINFLLANSSRI